MAEEIAEFSKKTDNSQKIIVFIPRHYLAPSYFYAGHRVPLGNGTVEYITDLKLFVTLYLSEFNAKATYILDNKLRFHNYKIAIATDEYELDFLKKTLGNVPLYSPTLLDSKPFETPRKVC